MLVGGAGQPGCAVDATGHQFDGGEARIVDYSTWFSDLKQRIGPTTLAKYARGSWSDCTDVSAAATFWTAPGTPLHASDATLLTRPGD